MKTCTFSKIEQDKVSFCVEEVLSQIEYCNGKNSHGSEITNYNIKLALWEIFANFVCHGTEESCYNVQVLIEESESEICIQIISSGNCFDWDETQFMEAPSVLEDRGRGLFILQQICHHFSYEEDGQVANMLFKKGEIQC